jgi:hypothetical protein
VGLAISTANAHHSTSNHAVNKRRKTQAALLTAIDLYSVKFYSQNKCLFMIFFGWFCLSCVLGIWHSSRAQGSAHIEEDQTVPKQIPTVKLTQIQLDTLEDMRKYANSKGVLSAALRGEYKQNVVGALIARGVLSEYANGSVRITNTPVELLVRTPRISRTFAAAA